MSDLLAIFLMKLVMFGDEGNSTTIPPPTISPPTILLQPLRLISAFEGYWSRKSRAILLLPLWAVRLYGLSACARMHFTFTFMFNLYRLCHVEVYIQFCLILLARKLVGIVHVIQWVVSFKLSILVKFWMTLSQLQVLFNIELCVMNMMGFICK